MTEKQVLSQYTQKFKLGTVRQFLEEKPISVVATVLGIPMASLGNWVGLVTKRGIVGANVVLHSVWNSSASWN